MSVGCMQYLSMHVHVEAEISMVTACISNNLFYLRVFPQILFWADWWHHYITGRSFGVWILGILVLVMSALLACAWNNTELRSAFINNLLIRSFYDIWNHNQNIWNDQLKFNQETFFFAGSSTRKHFSLQS